jgi:hypothetical protein
MTKWTTRALGGAAVVAGVLGSSAGAAEAAVIERVHYSDTFSDVYFDCGFPVEVEGEFSGTTHLRVGKGKTESAFFLHDNYQYREVHTNPANGKFFVVYGNGLFHETKAIRVEGSIFQFNAIDAGQPFTVEDQEGNVLLRDRGVVRFTILFDTQGDDVPGGIFIEELDVSFGGPHPGFFVDPAEGCALLS